MALVNGKFDPINELYASLFGNESDDEHAEEIIEEVFGTSDDDMEEFKVEEIKNPSKLEKRKQAYDDFSESKLEAAAAKLREKYRNLDNAKRQRKIQVVEDSPFFRRLQKPEKVILKRHPKSRLHRLAVF